jgi:hypothetical protein
MFEKQVLLSASDTEKLSPYPSLKNIGMNNAIKICEIHVTKMAVKVHLLTYLLHGAESFLRS